MKKLAFFTVFILFFYQKLAAQCTAPLLPIFIHDEKAFQFPLIVEGATNDDLSNPTQGVCDITLKLTHTWLGDARIELTSPEGTTVKLFKTGQSQYTDFTEWDISFVRCDSTAAPDSGRDAVFTNDQDWGTYQHYYGSYYPQEGCLESFNSGTVNGTWTLTVADDYNNDEGELLDFQIHFCDPSGISCHGCTATPTVDFDAAPDGYGAQFTNLTSDGIAWRWFFGDGSDSTDVESPFHLFQNRDTFDVLLVAYNNCGMDTAARSVVIEGAPPQVDFGWNLTSGCEPLGVHFTDSTTNNPTAWLWILPGASPDTSHLQSPVVQYLEAGTYSVTLVATNEVSSNSLIFNDLIQVSTNPTADFSIASNQGPTVVFQNNSSGATNFEWNFGDGQTSTEPSPSHIFPSTGNYFVSLVAKNDCGDDFTSATVPIFIVADDEPTTDFDSKISVFPNPTSTGVFSIKMDGLSDETSQLILTNSIGQLIETRWITAASVETFHLEKQPTGIYFLTVKTGRQVERQAVSFIK